MSVQCRPFSAGELWSWLRPGGQSEGQPACQPARLGVSPRTVEAGLPASSQGLDSMRLTDPQLPSLLSIVRRKLRTCDGSTLLGLTAPTPVCALRK